MQSLRFNTTSYRWLAHLRELGIHRKAYIIFQDTSISASCLRCIILPLYEYCAQVWSSVAVCHLHLLHQVVRTASFLWDGSILGDLSNRPDVSSICMIFKIRSKPFHPLNHLLHHACNRSIAAPTSFIVAYCPVSLIFGTFISYSKGSSSRAKKQNTNIKKPARRSIDEIKKNARPVAIQLRLRSLQRPA